MIIFVNEEYCRVAGSDELYKARIQYSNRTVNNCTFGGILDSPHTFL